jgi:pSer/pThr/pTyr-binding forkhead associated (FHA) protein
VTRFIERPALLESLANAAAQPDEPEAPAPSVTPSQPLPASESTTVILGSAARRTIGIQLVANTGPAQGTVFDVGEAGATLGRLPDNSICLTDGRLSRHHAQIDFRDGGYWISDLASQNGTLVNDRPLTDAHRLQAGDSIELGTTRLTVVLDSDD